MEILLQRGEMLVLEGERRGFMVHCGDGTLWITQKGDCRDHLLKRGKSFKSHLPGRIVVTALADSRLAAVHGSQATSRSTCSLPLGIAR